MTSHPQRGSAAALDLSQLMDHGGIGQVVLRHLASTEDRVRICRSVSKECRELVDSQVTRLRANLRSFSSASPLASTLPLHLPRLRQLSFDRGADGDASLLLAQLVQVRPALLARLEQLDLANCQGLESGTLQQLLQACHQLRSLTLPALAGSVTSSRLEFIEALSTHGTHLTQLLGVGDYVDANSVPLLAQMTALQHLDLSPGKSNIVLTAPALRPLATLSNLRSLQLGNHLACYETCSLAASLPQLENLSFSYVDDYSMGPPDLLPLAVCRSLRSLTLCCVACSDDLLESLARTSVSSLTLLAGTFTATPKGLARLQGQLQQLQLRINDKDIDAFAAALPSLQQLQRLSVSIHRATADCRGLMQAVFGLRNLEELNLEAHYSSLREAEMQDLPVLPQLRQLSLCNHFSDATLCCLLRSSPQLHQLRLTSCGSISDVGLSCAVSHCRQLRQVVLALMRGVGIAGVGALAAAPSVSRVQLEGCRNVLAEECRELMRLLNKPHLEVVKLR